jgi:hypothetical protein
MVLKFGGDQVKYKERRVNLNDSKNIHLLVDYAKESIILNHVVAALTTTLLVCFCSIYHICHLLRQLAKRYMSAVMILLLTLLLYISAM